MILQTSHKGQPLNMPKHSTTYANQLQFLRYHFVSATLMENLVGIKIQFLHLEPIQHFLIEFSAHKSFLLQPTNALLGRCTRYEFRVATA